MKLPCHVAAFVTIAFMASFGFAEPDDDRPSKGLNGDNLKSSVKTMAPRIEPATPKQEEAPKVTVHKNYPNPF